MRAGLLVSIVAFGAVLAGCTPEKAVETAQPSSSTQTAAPSPIALPVSINAVMVALVDHASEPLWLDAYQPPKTDDHWREAQYNAYQLAIAGKLVQLAGSGPNDADWVAAPEWRGMADELSAAGMDALRAAQAKSVSALEAAGDRLVAACESCHKKFKPDLTSMGIYKSPNYPPKGQ